MSATEDAQLDEITAALAKTAEIMRVRAERSAIDALAMTGSNSVVVVVDEYASLLQIRESGPGFDGCPGCCEPFNPRWNYCVNCRFVLRSRCYRCGGRVRTFHTRCRGRGFRR